MFSDIGTTDRPSEVLRVINTSSGELEAGGEKAVRTCDAKFVGAFSVISDPPALSTPEHQLAAH